MEIEGEDFDTFVRLQCLNLANDIAERAAASGNFMMTDPDCLVEAAAVIEHYASNGMTVAFDAGQEALRKCVSGGR